MEKKLSNKIIINDREVSTTKIDGELRILHAPTGTHSVLDDIGTSLWMQIQNGVCDVEELVKSHAKNYDISNELAAFQVISFLDELRDQHFIKFELTGERDSAPLLDTNLSELRPHFIKRLETESANLPQRNVVVVETPNNELKLREIRLVAERLLDQDILTMSEAIVLSTEDTELTISELEKIISNPNNIGHPKVNLLGVVKKPTFELSLAELTKPFSQSATRRSNVGTSALRRGLIVIVIVTDDTIVVILITTSPGPSAGKSRSACKTMCV